VVIVNLVNAEQFSQEESEIRSDDYYEYYVSKKSKMEIFVENLQLRNLYYSIILGDNSINPRFKKLVLVFNSWSLMFIVNAVIYTSDAYTTITTNTSWFVLYSFIAAVLANILVIPVAFVLRTKLADKKELYNGYKDDHQITMIKEWTYLNRINKVKTIIGSIINLGVFAGTFYYTFGFCVIWSELLGTVVIGWMISILIFDMLILELISEGIVMISYTSRWCSVILKYYDFFRNVKSLV